MAVLVGLWLGFNRLLRGCRNPCHLRGSRLSLWDLALHRGLHLQVPGLSYLPLSINLASMLQRLTAQSGVTADAPGNWLLADGEV